MLLTQLYALVADGLNDWGILILVSIVLLRRGRTVGIGGWDLLARVTILSFCLLVRSSGLGRFHVVAAWRV